MSSPAEPAAPVPGSPSGTSWIIVLAWNGWEDTEECLRSLAPVAARGHRLLLVDNGSTDGTPSRARSAYPGLDILETGSNLGFAAGNNAGIRHALARGAGSIILLNNDTVVAPDFADELVAVARAHPRAGSVTAKIYFHDQPERLWFAGGRFSTWTGRATHAGYGKLDRGQFDHVTEIGRPCGCAMLLTRTCLEDIGLLEESLYLYGEEIDWALRATAAGWKSLLAPRARVWHKVSRGTGGEESGRFYYYAVRNMLTILDARAPRRRPLAAFRRAIVLLTFGASTARSRVRFVSACQEIIAGAGAHRRGERGPRKPAPSPGAVANARKGKKPS